jgi:hypothetical protein
MAQGHVQILLAVGVPGLGDVVWDVKGIAKKTWCFKF